jgi:protein angel
MLQNCRKTMALAGQFRHYLQRPITTFTHHNADDSVDKTGGALSHRSLRWESNQSDMAELGKLKLATFNMLAPCYKRLKGRRDPVTGRRVLEKNVDWRTRAEQALVFFRLELLPKFELIALQEFWLEDDYVEMFRTLLGALGYSLHILRRHPTRKEDAVAFLCRTSALQVKSYAHITLCEVTNRVALLMWLVHNESKRNIIVANTHLSFPHTPLDAEGQIEQIDILLHAMNTFANVKSDCPDSTRIIMGDFNVETDSQVCHHLTQSGYISCLDANPPQGLSSLRSFVTHRTHRNEDVGVDHIFFKPEVFSDGAPVNGTGTSTSTSGRAGSVFVADTFVLPATPCTVWDDLFTVSDHRPVGAHLVFGSEK